MATTTYAWLVIAFPLAGMLVVAAGFRLLPGRSAGWIATAAIFLAFAAAVGALISLQGHAAAHRQLVSTLWDYAVTVGVNARVTILVDPLSVYMILLVSGISALIHLYSVAYMDEDRGFARYFSYLNYFVFSMLLLVLAGNFLLLIAAVGAVVLARRRRGLDGQDERDVLTPLDLLRPRGTGTMAEGVGKHS